MGEQLPLHTGGKATTSRSKTQSTSTPGTEDGQPGCINLPGCSFRFPGNGDCGHWFQVDVLVTRFQRGWQRVGCTLHRVPSRQTPRSPSSGSLCHGTWDSLTAE